MNKRSAIFRCFLLVVLLTFPSACQAQPTLEVSLTPTLQSSPSSTVFLSPTPTLTATETTTFLVTDTPSPTLEILPSATVQVDPLVSPPAGSSSASLRFVFPTPRPAPVSAWRPALYDVPWAITPNDHFYFTRPIAADEVNWPLADYRYGAAWPGMENVIHSGVDIDAPVGTPVMAAASGKVVWVGYGLSSGSENLDDPYGLAIMILHDFGYQGYHLMTVYAHLSEIGVVTGQVVSSGEVIGKVGITGLTTGPHLHFEVRVESSSTFYTTRNPELWLVPPQGWGVLVGKIMLNSWTPLYQQDVYLKSVANGNTWLIRTYADSAVVHSDGYYDENLVLSDLPAGDYIVSLTYDDTVYSHEVTILPGMVNYLSFTVTGLFSTVLPTQPSTDFLSTLAPTNTP
jgi:murein DD-endopeptidase MepM/ murein hydrolase activator NlpD